MNILGRNIDFTITPTVSYGLVALMAFFGYAAAGLYSDSVRRSAEDDKVKYSEYLIMEQIKDTSIWNTRLSESVNLRNQTDMQIWSGDTSGRIAAELTQTLHAIAEKQNLPDVTVRIDPNVTDINGAMVLSFDYVLRLPKGKGVVDILAMLAKEQRSILILETTFAHSLRDRRPTRLSISGVIPVKLINTENGIN